MDGFVNRWPRVNCTKCGWWIRRGEKGWRIRDKDQRPRDPVYCGACGDEGMTSHKDRNQTGISTIPIINVDSVAWTDACPNCHIAWKRHLVWRDKQQVLWDPLSPIWMYLGERSATPVCELHNGHLANILNMLTKKIVAGNRQHEPMRDALITEARRRGWDNLDRWTKGPKVLENSL